MIGWLHRVPGQVGVGAHDEWVGPAVLAQGHRSVPKVRSARATNPTPRWRRHRSGNHGCRPTHPLRHRTVDFLRGCGIESGRVDAERGKRPGRGSGRLAGNCLHHMSAEQAARPGFLGQRRRNLKRLIG